MNNKYKFVFRCVIPIFGIFLLVIIELIFSENIKLINEEKNNYINNYENILVSERFEKYIKENINKNDKLINNRYVLLEENSISIGKNKKEIENGYLDIKLSIEKEFPKIQINKLFKEFNSENYDEENIYVDTEYVKDIVEFINLIYGFNMDELYKEDLLNIILTQYTNVRKNYINNYNEYQYTTNINYGKNKIRCFIENSELIVMIDH